MADIPPPWPGWPYGVVRYVLPFVWRAFLGVHYRGRQHIPVHGPAVLMANHESFLDPLLMVELSPRPIQFMAKQELFRGFGHWLFPRLNTAPVKRGAADLGAFRTAARHLAGGGLLGIFPEGTRSTDGRIHPFQTGAIAIALKAGAPIIPVALHGTGEVLPPTGFRRLHPVAIAAGPPLRLIDLPDEPHRYKRILMAVGELVRDEVARLKAQLIDEMAERYGGPPPANWAAECAARRRQQS